MKKSRVAVLIEENTQKMANEEFRARLQEIAEQSVDEESAKRARLMLERLKS